MLNHHLLLRITLLNIAGAVGVVWAHANGYVVPMFVSDTTNISYGIAALFGVMMASVYWRGWKIGGAKNMLKAGTARAYIERRAAKMFAKNDHIADGVNWLQGLGLLGTIIGFSMALGSMSADDPSGVESAMRTAIGTTIIGTILGMWLDVARRMLDTATAALAEDMS